ncbi:MAG: PKD domain-containing protein, partial [Bacteroidota bacterium]
MDMLFTKDGQLYVLEYGQKWNSRNLDARLSVIKYNAGNRPPNPHFVVDKEVGAAPLKVHFSAAKSMDYDQDELSYTWKLGAEERKSNSPELDYVFEELGVYDVELVVADGRGEQASINQKILVGNEPPQIKIELSSDNTTYWKNKKLNYQVVVNDAEDGSSSDSTLDPSKVKVTFDYIPEGEDLILASIGHQQNAMPLGLELINGSDCKACHAIDKQVAGPSFEAIATRYDQSDKQLLMHRIAKGSQGVWGEIMMAPHPQLKINEIEAMVDYILSLDPQKQVEESNLPLAGSLEFDKHLGDEIAGKYILMASYLDNGHPEVAGSELSVVEQAVFIAPRIELENGQDLDKELGVWQTQGHTVVGSIRDGKHIKFPKISFDQLFSVSIAAAFGKDYAYAGEVEVRKGKVDGPILGKGSVEYYNADKEGYKVFEITLAPQQGLDSLFLVFKNEKDDGQYAMNGDWIQLNYVED